MKYLLREKDGPLFYAWPLDSRMPVFRLVEGESEAARFDSIDHAKGYAAGDNRFLNFVVLEVV